MNILEKVEKKIEFLNANLMNLSEFFISLIFNKLYSCTVLYLKMGGLSPDVATPKIAFMKNSK